MACGLSQQTLERRGWLKGHRCVAVYENASGEEVECGCLFTKHRDETVAPPALAQVETSYKPSMFIQLNTSFTPHILQKYAEGSIHGSSVVSGDEETFEIQKEWFLASICRPGHFYLQKPECNDHSVCSRNFADYISSIRQLGFSVWDIQNKPNETVHVALQDTNGLQKAFSGHADYIIATDQSTDISTSTIFARCIIEIQSSKNEETCEFHLMSYLFILMNLLRFQTLAGILVLTNGTCRAFRAKREPLGDVMYEQNDTFELCQIKHVLPVLLNM